VNPISTYMLLILIHTVSHSEQLIDTYMFISDSLKDMNSL